MNAVLPIRRPRPPQPALRRLALALAMALPTAGALAQTADEAQLVRDELKALREDQSRIVEMQRRNEAAIRALEAARAGSRGRCRRGARRARAQCAGPP